MHRKNRKPPADGMLTAVLQAMNEAVVVKSAAGTITLWNRAAAELFGYTPPEVIGEKADILIPPGELRHWRECEKRLRGGGAVRRINAVRLAKDGVRIRVILTATVVEKSRPAESDIVEIYRAPQATGADVLPAGGCL